MLSKFAALTTLGLLCALPTVAAASPYAAFTIHKGTQQEALSDGTVPQAIVVLVLSDSNTACADLLSKNFRSNKHYLLTRLSALPTGDGLAGCYETPNASSNAEGCVSRRGAFDGIEFIGTSNDENAGAAKSAKFITGGQIKIDNFVINEDGTGRLNGFANVRLGDIATGGVIEAEWCRPAETSTND